jgi:retron-type reverse transcriptase
MGFWDWITGLFAGPRGPRLGPRGDCPHCGAALRSDRALQCLQCGATWHTGELVVGATLAEPRTGVSIPPAGSPASAGAAQQRLHELKQQAERKLAALEISQFSPLPASEVKKQARQLGSLWSSPWFGRRDLIPPVTDPRTLLIDRAMVAEGLIAPEQLQEIHEVGAAMDRIRPDLIVAGQMARDAVARTQEERRQLKLRKKAEAEERRRQRAAEVARRKATDITFLGRGVSAGLSNRMANTGRLAEQGLPVLSTPAELAAALGVSISRLRWLAFHSPAATRVHYIWFEVPKRGGGLRKLSAPHRSLAACQEWVLRQVLDKLPAHPAAQGFIVGRSTLTNAQPHVGRQVVVNVDIKDFFPSISFYRVCGLLKQVGYSPAVATIMALLCTESPRSAVTYDGTRYFVATGPRALPQGACTSPALSNLIARRLDSRLSGLARRLGWAYTRYADDMTFSADEPAAPLVGYLLARVRHIVAAEGFVLNESKTRVQRRNTAQNVTGVVVNDRPAVPRKLVRRLRAILHQSRRTGLAAQNRQQRTNFEAYLRGMIAYIAMINPQQARPLQDGLRALESAGG